MSKKLSKSAAANYRKEVFVKGSMCDIATKVLHKHYLDAEKKSSLNKNAFSKKVLSDIRKQLPSPLPEHRVSNLYMTAKTYFGIGELSWPLKPMSELMKEKKAYIDQFNLDKEKTSIAKVSSTSTSTSTSKSAELDSLMAAVNKLSNDITEVKKMLKQKASKK